jgi:hypothetical protein
VTKEHMFETAHASPQPPLWAWGDDEWLPVLRLPAYAARTTRTAAATQLPLFPAEQIA